MPKTPCIRCEDTVLINGLSDKATVGCLPFCSSIKICHCSHVVKTWPLRRIFKLRSLPNVCFWKWMHSEGSLELSIRNADLWKSSNWANSSITFEEEWKRDHGMGDIGMDQHVFWHMKRLLLMKLDNIWDLSFGFHMLVKSLDVHLSSFVLCSMIWDIWTRTLMDHETSLICWKASKINKGI